MILDPSGAFYHLWIGGWRNCAEMADGQDKIFHATSPDLKSWTFDAQPAIADPSAHFNDPSVVLVPNPGAGQSPVFLMYLTECVDSPAPSCFDPGGNVTFGATSYDGVSWSAPAPVILSDNGYNQLGAWAPSALVVNATTLYLYYMDSNGDLLRTAIDPSTGFFTPLGPAEYLGGPYYANVGVVLTAGGTYELVYNDGTFGISRAISSDGVAFAPDPTFNPLSGQSQSPPYWMPTPFEYLIDSSDYWLFFGWGAVPVAGSPLPNDTPQQWLMQRAVPR